MGRLIAIDPGVNNTGIVVLESPMPGLAILKNVHLEDRDAKVFAMNFGLQISNVNARMRLRPTKERLTIVIEKPQSYPDSPVRVNDLIALSVMAGGLAAAVFCASKSMTEIYMPTPREWKGTVPKDIHNARILERLPELKEHLKPYPKSKHEHIIDAAGLGLWAIEQGAKR